VVYRTDRRANQADSAMRMHEFPAVGVGFVRTPIGLDKDNKEVLSSMAFLADVSPSGARPIQDVKLPRHLSP
jgi:hypothetical protein